MSTLTSNTSSPPLIAASKATPSTPEDQLIQFLQSHKVITQNLKIPKNFFSSEHNKKALKTLLSIQLDQNQKTVTLLEFMDKIFGEVLQIKNPKSSLSEEHAFLAMFLLELAHNNQLLPNELTFYLSLFGPFLDKLLASTVNNHKTLASDSVKYLSQAELDELFSYFCATYASLELLHKNKNAHYMNLENTLLPEIVQNTSKESPRVDDIEKTLDLLRLKNVEFSKIFIVKHGYESYEITLTELAVIHKNTQAVKGLLKHNSAMIKGSKLKIDDLFKEYKNARLEVKEPISQKKLSLESFDDWMKNTPILKGISIDQTFKNNHLDALIFLWAYDHKFTRFAHATAYSFTLSKNSPLYPIVKEARFSLIKPALIHALLLTVVMLIAIIIYSYLSKKNSIDENFSLRRFLED